MGNEDVELVTRVESDRKRPLIEKYDIPIEKLSFEYITGSHNAKEIEKMILILRSGEEGYFPDLLRHAENRLEMLKPDSQVLRIPQPILTPGMLNKEQREVLNNEMTQWMRQMYLREKDLEDGKALELTDTVPRPEVRRVANKSKNSTAKDLDDKKSQRIKSCDYSSWDKYDADTEVNRIDLKAQQELVKAKQFQQKMREKRLAEREAINKMALTGTEITVLAEKEREKGNEAFRAGDYEEALQQYSLSLEIDSTINGYNNRAITYIKLGKFQEAIRDCDRVLSLDYSNVKALLRRASALESLGRKEGALENYSAALMIEPNNKTAITGVRKLSTYNNSKKVRMTIEELDENDEVVEEKPVVKKSKPSTTSDVQIQEEKSSKDQLIISSHSKPIIEEINIIEDKIIEPEHLLNSGGKEVSSIVSETKVKDEVSTRHKLRTSNNSKPIIEEIKSTDGKIIDAKLLKCETRGVKFAEGSKTVRRSNEICFCDRAPGSSTYVKPLPHRRGEYCLGVKRNENKQQQSIFTFSHTCFNYSKPSGVVIEEIPSEPCDRIPIEKTGQKRIDKRIEENHREEIKKSSEDFRRNVDSPYEFLCTWESLKGDTDLKLHARLIRSLNSTNLESIVGSRLDGDMFSTILRCLERHFCREEDLTFVHKFLKALTQLRRFSIVSMFTDARDKKAVKNIIYFLEQHEVSDTSSLRNDYSIVS